MSRSPSAASADIAADAFEGKLIAAILIPVFQMILLKTAVAVKDVPSPESALINPVQYAQVMIVAFGLFGVGITVISIIVSYQIAGLLGVFAYFFFDFLVAGILNTIPIAAATFAMSIPVFAFLFWIRRKLLAPSHSPRVGY